MEKMEKAKLLSDIATSWIGLLGVLGALFFGINQYIQNNNSSLSDKKKESLTFLENYSNEQMVISRRALDEVAIPILGDALRAAKQANSAIEANKLARNAIDSQIVGKIESNQNNKEINEVVLFLDRAWNCVELDLCDKEAT